MAATPNYRMIERALKAVAPTRGDGGFGASPAPYIGPGPSPLVQSYNEWSWAGGHSYGTNSALPREWMTFLSGMFGPLAPIQPVPIDVPQPGESLPEPRVKQLPVGWNMPMGMPGTEGIGKLADFQTLRTICDLYSVARDCINLRKNELRGIGWDIGPTRETAKAMRGDHRAAADFAKRQAKLIKFFRKPDPNYPDFGTWFSAITEEFFVTDAPALYFHPSRAKNGGVLGSNLAALETIDGTTIRPLIDVRGGVPAPPNPAWQQFLFGVPRVDLMTLRTGGDLEGVTEDQVVAEYRASQLRYMPYSPRVWSPYGMAWIENAIIPVVTGIQKQAYQMQYFSEGSIPGLFVSPGDTSLTPGQLKVLQDALNALGGDQAWKHKIVVLPGGSKAEPMRPGPLADDLDTLLQIETCAGFDVQPFEIGVIPQLSAAAASSGTARLQVGARVDIRQRKSTIPILLFLKAAIFDWVIQDICGQRDMEWRWEGLDEDENIQELTEALVAQVGAGLLSIDEARQILGREPWGLPITSDPGWATQWGGLVPLTGVTEATAQPLGGSPGPGGPGRGARNTQGAPGAPVDLTKPGAVARPGSPAAPSTVPRNRLSTGQRRGQAHQVTSTQNRTGSIGTPAHSGARSGAAARKAIMGALTAETLGEFQAAAGAPLWAQMSQVAAESEDSAGTPAGDAETAKAIRELGLLRSHLRRGEPVSAWEPRHISPRLLSGVAENMAKGLNADQACEVAKAALAAKATGYSLNPRSGMISLDLPEGLIKPVPGGVDDHHVTVVYLGPDVDDEAFDTACDRAMAAAAMMPGPIEVAVQGLAQFAPSASSDGKWPTFAEVLPDGALRELREHLVDLSASEHKDWTPHVTLAYLNENDPMPPPVTPVPVTFTHLSVHRGGEVKRFPFDSHIRKSAESSITCGEGHRHWDAHGAAGLLIRAKDGKGKWRFLLQRRGETSDHPGTWGIPGGALHEGEHPAMGAIREATEELGVLPNLRPHHSVTDDHDGWAYTTYVTDAPAVFQPRTDGTTGHETAGWAWLTAREVESYPLHPGFQQSWRQVRLARRSKTIAKDMGAVQGEPAAAEVVRRQLLDHFPPEAVTWVRDAAWTLAEVPLRDVNFEGDHQWAAWHDPDRVAHFARQYRAGQPVDPCVLVREPGKPDLRIADGHHRCMGAREAGLSHETAFVGTIPAGDMRWASMHVSQEHGGFTGKSAETPALSTTHNPLGPHSLWHTPDRHVSSPQSLPDYIENVAHALEREGRSESEAIALAIASVKAWAAGHAFGGKVRVTPVVQAAAQRALDEWDRLKSSHAGR